MIYSFFKESILKTKISTTNKQSWYNLKRELFFKLCNLI